MSTPGRRHEIERERIGAPGELRLRREEGGVDHVERAEQAALQDLAERSAFDDFDDAPEHVGGEAVLPDLARLMHERKRGHRLDIFGQRPVRIHDVRRLDQLLDRRRAGEAVGQPRRVAHQVLDRDRPLERRKIELVAVGDADLHVGEGGDVFRDRIGDEKPPLLDQHHRRDRNDRLGHRIDAEDRVVASSAGRPGASAPTDCR